MPQQPQQSDMQQHMQALTELRQFVRAEQNRPVLGASQKSMQGGGPSMGNLSSILSSMLGGGGGGANPMMQQMMGGMGRAAGGMPAPMTSSIASGRPPGGSIGPGSNPGSLQQRRRKMGGLMPMPGMGNYPGMGMR